MLEVPGLLEAYRLGDKDAFLFLYDKHHVSLKKFLQNGFNFSSQGRMCRFKGTDSFIDAEAIVQETFARAFSKTTRKNYDGERPFQTYLFSIAKNLVLRECNKRERLVDIDIISEQTRENKTDFPLNQSTGSICPEEYVQNLELKDITQNFIKKLSKEEERLFFCRFVEGNTQEGSAKLMDTTRARIKLLEKNVRKRFLDLLRKNGYLVEHRMSPRWQRKEIKKVA